MGLSWYSDNFDLMKDELRDFLNEETELSSADVAEVLNGIINIMIDNGAVDPA